MPTIPSLGVILLGYLIGAIPFGYMLVWLRTGKDIRKVHSGRTGGTNAMRAAGKRIGVLTGIFDIFKGYTAAQLALWLAPGEPWIAVLTPLAAVLGHNYSIFLARQTDKGEWQLAGGAGGAPMGGGAVGLWLPSLYIMLPIGLLIFYFVGYASVTTLSIAVMTTILFMIRAWLGLAPWEYVAYGLGGLALLAWALRPNIKRLFEGTEPFHGYRARKLKQRGRTKRKTKSRARIAVRQN